MKERAGSGPSSWSGNVRGHLLGTQVSTRPAVQTSAKPIGAQVSALIEPLQSGKSGAAKFVSPAFLAAWPEIVGERLAGLCLPVQMKAKPKSRSRHKKPGDDGAVLEVRADPSIQIDLDYGQVVLVERINAFFGYQAVASLKVLAKPMPHAQQRSAQSGPPPASVPMAQVKQAEQAAQASVAPVENDALRKALADLGAAVLSQSPAKR